MITSEILEEKAVLAPSLGATDQITWVCAALSCSETNRRSIRVRPSRVRPSSGENEAWRLGEKENGVLPLGVKGSRFQVAASTLPTCSSKPLVQCPPRSSNLGMRKRASISEGGIGGVNGGVSLGGLNTQDALVAICLLGVVYTHVVHRQRRMVRLRVQPCFIQRIYKSGGISSQQNIQVNVFGGNLPKTQATP